MKLKDIGKSLSLAFTREKLFVSEKLRYRAQWKIRRWENEDAWRNGKDPYSVSVFEKNLLLNEGINELWTLACSSSGTKFDNANARLGVGTSNVAESATQTGLQGGTTTFKAMDTGFPTYGTAQKATWRATFQSADGNHAWEEFTVDNGAAANKNLNRKVSSQGTKVSGQVWELTLEITLS
jgi:hypothetical protein